MQKSPPARKGSFAAGVLVILAGANLIALSMARGETGMVREIGFTGLALGFAGLLMAWVASRSLAIHHAITDLLLLPLAGIVISLGVFMPSLLAMGTPGRLILANGTGAAVALALLVARRGGFRGS
jgi:hypothetical protein